jgi:hypothetical protein
VIWDNTLKREQKTPNIKLKVSQKKIYDVSPAICECEISLEQCVHGANDLPSLSKDQDIILIDHHNFSQMCSENIID